MRIGVISSSQKHTDRPERYVSKNAAAALVRRLLAIPVAKHLIQMVDVRCAALPAQIQVRKWAPAVYEHHIEPRIERIPELDRLVAEWACAEHFWAT
jgi:hypothetical protein